MNIQKTCHSERSEESPFSFPQRRLQKKLEILRSADSAQNDTRVMWRFGFLSAFALAAVVFFTNASGVRAALTAAAQPKLEVFPSDFHLFNKREGQLIVARTTDPDGVTHDVTAKAKFTFADPKFAKLEKNTLFALADGKTDLRVDFGGQSVTVSVVVEHADLIPATSFKRDVMPVFLRSGCNTGGCHGSARGKDGFRLSLFGFDADGDYQRITREMGARRINLALPQESLLVTKGAGLVSHTGGKRFEKNDELYNTLIRWIEAGAPADPADIPMPVSVDISPKQSVLQGENEKQQLVVRAKYSDGSVRDVTSLAFFFSNNESSAKISPDGQITAGQRGEAFLMARFGTFNVGAEVIVIPKKVDVAWHGMPEKNYIDGAINRKLQRLRIVPSEICGDEEFLRRAYIDLVGTLPTPSEHDAFIADTDANKREKLVDMLLTRHEFVDLWVMKWAELLRVRTTNNQVSYKQTLIYYNWLQDKLSHNVPINQIARDILSATGGNFENPPTNYYEAEIDPLKLAEDTAQVFLGVRIQCAQCHNHPFDRWTMSDYQGFVAFFQQIGRKKGEDPRETIVFNRGNGEAKHPVTGAVVPPKFLGADVPDVKNRDRREALGEWLASKENPYFAKHVANMAWGHFFGRGIVEPVDDTRVSNPPSNSELIDLLGQKVTEYDFNFKRIVRDICTSTAYQLSSITNATNELDVRNFSHAQVRRMRAEVLLDAISQVTETKNKFKGLPLGARAVEIADGETTSFFLKTFGRASRETVCTCEVSMEPNLSQALHLINGETVHQKIQQGGVIQKFMKENRPPADIVDNLYLRTLTRKPSDPEAQSLTPQSADQKETAKQLEDVFWALLNSKEFIFNH
jgi:uncharacterized protein DUF1549/uncharacterized protein DUF1553